MIVADTNVLFALADRRDAHHAQCRDWLAGCGEPLIVLPTVLTEACYLIDKYLGPAAEATFLDSIGIVPATVSRSRAWWMRTCGDKHLT